MNEVAILIGLQAAGKTTFYRQHLAGTHRHVSKDTMRHNRNKQRRQLHLIAEALEAGDNVVVDNTNPSPDEWRPIINLGHQHGAVAVSYWFPPDIAKSLRRNARRANRERVPDVGIYATLKRLRPPSVADGFDRLWSVADDDEGGFLVTPGPMATPGSQGTAAAAPTAGRAPVQHAAVAVGAVFLLVGVLGFVPGITTRFDTLTFAGHHSEAALFGVFAVSGLHNAVHLVFGVLGPVFSGTYNGAARTFSVAAQCMPSCAPTA